MTPKIIKFNIPTGTTELGKEDLIVINGGSFAYDLGFLLREGIIYLANGAGTYGTLAAITDLGMNYRPVH
jgi:hypothetical protein